MPVFNRKTFLDPRMQSYNRTLDLNTPTIIRKHWPASKTLYQRRFAGSPIIAPFPEKKNVSRSAHDISANTH